MTATRSPMRAPLRLPHPVMVLWRAVRTIWANPKSRIGIVLLVVFLAMTVLAPVLAPYGPENRAFRQNDGPSSAHWLGTTAAGQDVLSQLMYGTRVSVFVGIVAGALSTLVAIVVGLSWGYMRSFLGDVVNFVVNLFLVIPALPLMIVIAAYLQNGGIGVIILVVVITGWAWGARVLRSQTQSLRSRDFVTAAVFSGESPVRVIFREILPNMTSLIVGSFFGAATAAVLAEAGLEFLGLGDSRTISWGTMLFWAQNSNALLTGQWVLLLAPGLCIATLATAMALVIFGVDALSNPKLREAAQQ